MKDEQENVSLILCYIGVQMSLMLIVIIGKIVITILDIGLVLFLEDLSLTNYILLVVAIVKGMKFPEQLR